MLNAIANDNVIVMGYKDKDKLPLIGGYGDDNGLYRELFEKAAASIGYRLKIIRLSKKRIHLRLKSGEIDFYPGTSFSQKRAAYLYYLPNGLQTKEVLLSLSNHKEIKNIKDATGILIAESGSSKIEWDKLYPGLKIQVMTKLPIDIAILALQKKRGDFYVADIEVIQYYKFIKNIKNYEQIGIKVHYNAINQHFIPMYLGFSRKSSKFSEIPNPNYDPTKKVSIKNFPTIISKNCVAYKFYKALDKLKQDGTTAKLYKKYFNTYLK
jgi:hypothetical protein